MLTANSKRLNDDISIDSISIETDFINDSSRRVSISIPPIKSLLRNKDFSPAIYSQVIGKNSFIEENICEQKIYDLIQNEERFNDSYTFYMRVSGLYDLCGKPVDALNYAKKALLVNSDNAHLKYKLGEKLLGIEDDYNAYQIFSELDKDNYDSATLRLAERKISNNNFEDGLKLSYRIIENNKYDWRANLLAGTINLVIGNYDKAIHLLRNATYERTNLPSIYINLGIAYFLLGQYEKSINEAKKALNLNPTNKSALTLLTDVVFIEKSEQELKTSKYYIDKFINYSDISKYLINKLSNYYYLTDSYNDGIKLLDNVKNLFNSPDIWNNLGVFWVKKNPKTATIYFQKAIDVIGGIDNVTKSRASELALLNLSGLFLEKKLINESLKLLSTYINTVQFERLSDDVLSNCYIHYVWCLISKNKSTEAINLLNEVYNHPNTYIKTKIEALSILTTYEILKLNQNFDAIEHAESALNLALSFDDIEPETKNMVFNNLIFAYLESDNIDKASNYINELKFNYSNSDYIYATLGLYFLKIGDNKNGEKNYRKAISLTHDFGKKSLFKQKLYYELGKLLLSSNDIKKAKLFFSKAVKLGKINGKWEIDKIYNDSKLMLSNL